MLSRFQVFDEDGKPKLDSSSSDVAQLNDLDDVALSPASSGQVLQHDGGHFINRSLASAGIAAAGDLASHESDTGNPHSVTAAQAGALAAANDLSDLNDAATARGNLGLGSAAQSNTGDFAAASHNHAAADINSGTLAHEQGGLEADVSAFDGLLKISGGATSQAAEGTDFYAPGGTDVPVSDGGTGASDAASARNNLSAARTHVLAVDPDADYDSADGVLAGDLALNTTSGAVFVCSDNSSGAAVWGQIGGGTSAMKTLPYDPNVFGGGSDGAGGGRSGQTPITLSSDMEYTTFGLNNLAVSASSYRILAQEAINCDNGTFSNPATSSTGIVGGTYCGSSQSGGTSGSPEPGAFANSLGGCGRCSSAGTFYQGGYPQPPDLESLVSLQELVDGKFGTDQIKGGCGAPYTNGQNGGAGGGVIILAAPILNFSNRGYPYASQGMTQFNVRGHDPSGAVGGHGVVVLVAEYILGHGIYFQGSTSYPGGGPPTLIVAARNAEEWVKRFMTANQNGNFNSYGSYGVGIMPRVIAIQLT